MDTFTTPGLLADKTILVTGASRGIGEAAARLFAAEGATVVLAARTLDRLDRIAGEIREAGGRATATPLDLADPASIADALAHVEEAHGRLDGALNNGAAIQTPGPIQTTAIEELDRMYTVNFRGQWLIMAAEAALMRRTGAGSIVNVSSIGSRRANVELPAYGAMKRALNSLTESAAVTWAGDGIRVNALTPGSTSTEMIDTWASASPGLVERIRGRVPMGRFAHPREVAEAAAWLLGDRASYVTGATLAVDGGAGA